MKKQGLLLVIVTLIDLVTVWPFQGTPMRVVDVLIGLCLLATLRLREKPSRPADYFGVGERVHLRQVITGYKGSTYGTVLGAATVPGLLRVLLDGESSERQLDPASLNKVSLWFDAQYPTPEYFRRHASQQSH